MCPECGECGEAGKDRGGESQVDVCAVMREYSAVEYRTHLYFVEYSHQVRSHIPQHTHVHCRTVDPSILNLHCLVVKGRQKLKSVDIKPILDIDLSG